jgi:hypothetical protein
MKAELRISIKDYHRKKTLKITLARAPYSIRQLLVLMNSQRGPADGFYNKQSHLRLDAG